MDLAIVQSGGAEGLAMVRRVLLEVVSDDCAPVYTQQPTCSEVVAAMAALGFAPLTPLPCTPALSRGPRANHRCELEYVFVNARLGVTAADGPEWARELYFEHHRESSRPCVAR